MYKSYSAVDKAMRKRILLLLLISSCFQFLCSFGSSLFGEIRREILRTGLIVTENDLTKTLTLVGTQEGDRLELELRGESNDYRLVVYEKDGRKIVRKYKAANLQRIEIDLGEGENSLLWQTLGDVQCDVRVDAKCGDDKDLVAFQIGRTGEAIDGRIRLGLSTGGGADQCLVKVSGLLENSLFDGTINTGNGHDNLSFELHESGRIKTLSRISVDTAGGIDEIFGVALGRLGKGSRCSVVIDGGNAFDMIACTYRMEVEGVFESWVNGNSGDDLITIDGKEISGRGALFSILQGDNGDDYLTSLFGGRDLRTAWLVVDGGNGHDAAKTLRDHIQLRIEEILP